MKNKNKRELEKLWAKKALEKDKAKAKGKPPKKSRPAATPAAAAGESGTNGPAKDVG
jgi:hypothetical protein